MRKRIGELVVINILATCGWELSTLFFHAYYEMKPNLSDLKRFSIYDTSA